MAVKYTTEAFVFGRENRLDADRVFSVFTRDFGRLEVFGKAIRRINSKLSGNIELFSFCEIEFVQGKNRKTLTDALLLQACGAIAQNPEKFEVANAISAVLGNFIKGQQLDTKIWDLVAEIFEKLSGPQLINDKFLYYYFFWNFMDLLGYGPELSQCVECSGLLDCRNLYFSNREGGMVCPVCFAKQRDAKKINEDTVKIMRLALKRDWLLLSKLKISLPSKKLLRDVSDSYLKYLSPS